MSTTEKVNLVASVRHEYGLSPAFAAAELPESTWYYHHKRKISYEDKYAHLQKPLEEIARQHSACGIQKVAKELRKSYGQVVNHKVERRLRRRKVSNEGVNTVGFCL